MNVVIERSLPKPGDVVRYGSLRANEFECKTFEWPEDGTPHKCLPSGTYKLQIGMHYGENQLVAPYVCYHIFNDEIPLSREFEVHIGNRLRDSKGCILLGVTQGTLEGEPAVLNSKIAFDEFMKTMNGVREATLVILYPSDPNLDT